MDINKPRGINGSLWDSSPYKGSTSFKLNFDRKPPLNPEIRGKILAFTDKAISMFNPVFDIDLTIINFALGFESAEKALAKIGNFLNNNDYFVRSRALEGIKRITRREGILIGAQPIITSLSCLSEHHSEPFIKFAATELLAENGIIYIDNLTPPGYRHSLSTSHEIELAKILCKFGKLVLAKELLYELFFSSLAIHQLDAALALAEIGEIGTKEIRKTIQLHKEDPDHFCKIKIAELLALSQEKEQAEDILLKIINTPNRQSVHRLGALEALSKIGSEKIFSYLFDHEELFALNESLAGSLISNFIENYDCRAFVTPTLQHHFMPANIGQAAKIAGVIQTIVPSRQSRKPKVSRSFTNRGIHLGLRGGGSQGGGDFDRIETLPITVLRGERVNQTATAKIASRGEVAINKSTSHQSRNVVIVLDPRLLKETTRENLSVLVGMLAQKALVQKDRVMLVIGDHTYIPLSANPSHLNKIIGSILSFQEKEGNIPLVSMARQNLVRKNLSPGSKLVLVSRFNNTTQKDLALMASIPGSEFEPIVVDSSERRKHQNLKLSTGKYCLKLSDEARMLWDLHYFRLFLGNLSYRMLQRVYLPDKIIDEKLLACNVDKQLKSPITDKTAETIQELSGKGRIVEEEASVRKTPPHFINELLKITLAITDDEARKESFKALVILAKLNGWKEVFDFINDRIKQALNSDSLHEREKKSLEKASVELERKDMPEALLITEEERGQILEDYSSLLSAKFEPHTVAYVLLSKMLSDKTNIYQRDINKFLCSTLDKHGVVLMGKGSMYIKLRSYGPLDTSIEEICFLAFGPSNKTLEELAEIEAFTGYPKIKEYRPTLQPSLLQRIKRKLTSFRTLIWGGLIASLMFIFGYFIQESSHKSEELGNNDTSDLNSGAADSNAEKQNLLTLNPPPAGRNAYLMGSIGGKVNPSTCGYSPIPEITAKSLEEEGESFISARATNGIKLGSPLHITGGRIISSTKETITYQVSDTPPPAIAHIKLSDFRKEAPYIYGKELYDTLTQPVLTLDELEESFPEVARDWKELSPKLEEMPLLTAIETIRQNIGKMFSYHHYKSFQQKLKLGFIQTLSHYGYCGGGALYLKTAIDYRGGVCAEMAEIGNNSLRIEKIPTIKINGFYVPEDGVVTSLGSHAYIAIPLPLEMGKFYGLPVEFSVAAFTDPNPSQQHFISSNSRNKLSKTLRGTALSLAFLVSAAYIYRFLAAKLIPYKKSKIGASEKPSPKDTKDDKTSQKRKEELEVPEIMRPVVKAWQRATPGKRREIAYSLETLYMMLGNNQTIRNRILQNPQRVVDGSKYFAGSSIDYNSDIPPYMDQILYRYTTVKQGHYTTLKWRKLFSLNPTTSEKGSLF
ncbi:hypothetical protein A2230_01380 [candidate division WOR-1 bacterium RIFOXYA2_FULL_36_21]|uniref:Uncharacterized protein n=1 Tax=candidate division WOR-1 bacterium RIFOXYB2_FULL_36_35 TaxID=1802578 RepID=A0A1F4S691_UNCSA|nr:MAG: hypothetical protein A2230_01380 [candidate division WOR-1 bacterium RIFOXYA2_FULL_36_21]OGC14373.1 MAG: hypothetical protein A2282_07975 [candidate division WOR-1 bacterium RIFOXYA12_FULL_36_13]OGC15951.1 MAG: hypothetical protein A2290_06850 [candidate division WOR-1 bacterium RIFOXYB2_FULL_36_35]